MLYLYAGGVFAVLVNSYFITRKFAKVNLISLIIILSLAIAFFPIYMGAVTEIDTDKYAQIETITSEIKDEQSAQVVKNLIAESMENKKISINEYGEIQDAYAEYTQKPIKQNIAKNGAKE